MKSNCVAVPPVLAGETVKSLPLTSDLKLTSGLSGTDEQEARAFGEIKLFSPIQIARISKRFTKSRIRHNPRIE